MTPDSITEALREYAIPVDALDPGAASVDPLEHVHPEEAANAVSALVGIDESTGR